jgi:hypothetical protein
MITLSPVAGSNGQQRDRRQQQRHTRKVSGSFALTPNNRLVITRVKAKAPINQAHTVPPAYAA